MRWCFCNAAGWDSSSHDVGAARERWREWEREKLNRHPFNESQPVPVSYDVDALPSPSGFAPLKCRIWAVFERRGWGVGWGGVPGNQKEVWIFPWAQALISSGHRHTHTHTHTLHFYPRCEIAVAGASEGIRHLLFTATPTRARRQTRGLGAISYSTGE